MHARRGLIWTCGLAGVAALAVTRPVGAQSARLELRIVPQSGLPGVAGAVPTGCVFDDAQGVVYVSAGVAKRFELQARVVDTDANDGLSVGGLLTTRIGITATRAGLWGRALLSSQEARSVVDPPDPGATADCSGRVTATEWRGVHGAFRGWDDGMLSPRPRNEDTRNGAFASMGISGVSLVSLDALGSSSRWVGVYSFEYTLPAGQSGDVGLSPRVEANSGSAPFTWVTTFGGVVDGMSVSTLGVLLRAPAPAVACCARGDCYIALTPTACFANAGRIARTGALGGCMSDSCCEADFNGDGFVGVQDVLDYVEAYILGDPRADINSQSGVTVQDLFDFLGLWFAGCPA